MKKIAKACVLALVLGVLAVALAWGGPGKMVHLKDGSVIQCQSVWKNDGKVMVLVNRDTLVELSRDEVDLKKTFGPPKSRPARKKVAAAAVSPEPAPSAAEALPAPQTPAPPAAPVAGKPASAPPAATIAPQPAQEPPPAPPAPVATPQPIPVPPAAAALPAMFGTGFLVGGLLFLLIIIASFWKVYEKAGEAGWKSLIPIYNVYVLVKIAGKPWWWFLLLFVPVVSLVILVLLHLALAARFGKGPLFGLGLAFIGFIFFPILAFDKSVYQA